MAFKLKILATVAMLSTAVAGEVQAQGTVRLAHGTEGFSYIAPFIAETMGYFKKAGVDVEMVRSSSGSQSLATVISGSAEVFIGSTESPINARLKGPDIVLFAAIFNQYSSNVTVSKAWAQKNGLTPASGLKERLAALKGITIGVTGPGSGTDQIVRYLAGEAGLNPDRDMTIVPLGSEGSAMLAAFSQGRVDGYSISSPASHLGIRDHGGLLLFNMGTGELPSLDGYFQVGAAANNAWLKRNPETAVKVAMGFQMALDALRDPATNVEARNRVHAARHKAIDPALYEVAWAELSKGMPKTVEVTHQMVQQIIEFRNRFAKDRADPAMADAAFTNEYAAKAVKAVAAMK